MYIQIKQQFPNQVSRYKRSSGINNFTITIKSLLYKCLQLLYAENYIGNSQKGAIHVVKPEPETAFVYKDILYNIYYIYIIYIHIIQYIYINTTLHIIKTTLQNHIWDIWNYVQRLFDILAWPISKEYHWVQAITTYSYIYIIYNIYYIIYINCRAAK